MQISSAFDWNQNGISWGNTPYRRQDVNPLITNANTKRVCYSYAKLKTITLHLSNKNCRISIRMPRWFAFIVHTHINAADKNNGTRFFVNLKKLLALKVAKITRHIVKIVTINCAC